MPNQPNIITFIADRWRGDRPLGTRLKISRRATNWGENPYEPDDQRLYPFYFGPDREMYPCALPIGRTPGLSMHPASPAAEARLFGRSLSPRLHCITAGVPGFVQVLKSTLRNGC